MHHTIDDKANHLNVLEDWTYTLKSYQGFYALKAHQGCRILDKDDGRLYCNLVITTEQALKDKGMMQKHDGF